MLKKLILFLSFIGLLSSSASPILAQETDDKFLSRSTWANGSCLDYYAQMLRTQNGATPENGGFYPGTVMVVGYAPPSRLYFCVALRYPGELVKAEQDALRLCKQKYQIDPSSCRAWIRVP